MKNRLNGKWALITGASSGIGEAVARLFAASDCNLILVARREQKLAQLKTELETSSEANICYKVVNVQDREACKKLVESISEPIDILFNNAGLASGKDAIYEASFNDWEAMIDTNIKGLLYLSRYVTAGMKQRNAGHIINTGSTAGHEAYAGGSVYCGTKHAVKAITEATKKDLHGTNVRVSMVSPGLVNTEFSKVRFHGDQQQADKVYEHMTPLTAGDVAEIVHFTANRPAHVNILDTVVMPVAQSSASLVARNEK